MYQLLNEIAERCYNTAKKRGQDTSIAGCMVASSKELAEYWNAADNGREIQNPAATLAAAAQCEDPKEFAAYYEANIHNTRTDELADLLIVAATQTWEAKRWGSEDYNPERDYNVLVAYVNVQFICTQVRGGEDVEYLRETVNLKMQFNDVREG